ncbi:MAG: iron transporter [Propionibacteriaceae bacterium]|jgi:uncharacterized protein involved in high-affinity Fe2+ transport|nr:iron transporter [Propionibacteriaceae bacterium]
MNPIRLLIPALAALVLAGCAASPTGATSPNAPESPADGPAAPGEVAGFEEVQIGDDIETGPLNVVAVYFQPVDMDPAMGLTAAEADIHIEADISALAGNDLGFGAGDWVPNLTVDYVVTDSAGAETAKGTFMPMNASDGPHYGANIKMGDAGVYTLKFTIKSGADNGHLIHTDATTGVTGRWWSEPLVAEWDNWEYTPREW